MEVALIARIRTGNIDAFEEIVDKYQFPLTRYLYRLTGDYELAKDLAQDTFIKAYNSILKTDSDLKLNAWLFRIATNTAIQHHRRKKIVSFIPFENMVQPENNRNLTSTDNCTDELAIKETFNKIPWDQRICMVLHYVEGFKYREIAVTLEISEDAVRKRVSRGVQLFRKLYNGGNGR